MEDGVPQPEAFLTSAESSEVLCSFGYNMGEQLYSDCAQRLAISCQLEEHLWVSVSGVLLNSGHLWRAQRRSITINLAHPVLTLAEGLFEGFGYFRGFELGRQLLNHTFTI